MQINMLSWGQLSGPKGNAIANTSGGILRTVPSFHEGMTWQINRIAAESICESSFSKFLVD